MWLILVLFAVFSFATARILQKKLLSSTSQDPITYAIYFQIFVALILLPIALINGFRIPDLTNLWGNMTIMVAFYSIANIFSFLSIKKIPISEFTLIMATIPIWLSITSIPLLRESANTLKLIGIALIVLGLIVAFYEEHKFKFNIGHLYALITAFCFGFAFTNDGFLLKSFDVVTYTIIGFITPALVIALFYPKNILGFKAFTKTSFITLFLTSFLFGLGTLAVYTSYKLGAEMSRAGSIIQMNSLVTIIFGVIFLKERNNLTRKIIGGFVVVLGAVLVGLK